MGRESFVSIWGWGLQGGTGFPSPQLCAAARLDVFEFNLFADADQDAKRGDGLGGFEEEGAEGGFEWWRPWLRLE